ncbi:MAG: MFS-type drug/proton antiporter [Ktedonobacterales bacterium]|jgi:MFS family permease|nr:MAG: MFS-type drug/proton antiporter [Ktedonobacterales bacterium]
MATRDTTSVLTEHLDRPRPPSLWRNRDFLLLWLGQALSSVGTEVSSLALPLLILALTHSPARAGVVAALGALPSIALGLVAGAWVDRVDRKRLMIVCDIVRALNLAALPVALAFGRLSFAQLCLFALVDGACSTFFRLANIVSLQRVVLREQIPAAVGRRETTEGIVTLLGPSLGGALFTVGRALPFVADAISYSASLLSLGLIRTSFQGERATARGRLRDEIGEGLRWLWRHRLVRFMALVYGGFGLLFPCAPLCVIVLAQQRGASPLIIGVIFAMGGIGGVLGALAGPWVQRRVRFGKLIPLLHWGYALLWPLEVFMPTPLLMGVIEALFLANDQVYDVTWPSYRLALIPDELQGRVTGASRLFSAIAQPIGLACAGMLIERIGAAQTMLVFGALLALLALIVTLNPTVRHAPPIEEVSA